MTEPLAWDDTDLSAMREQAQALMPETWALLRKTVTEGDLGDTTVWTVTAGGTGATGSGCRLMPAGYQAAQFILAQRPGAANSWTVSLPYGTAPTDTDKLLIGTVPAVGTVLTPYELEETQTPAYRTFEIVGSSGGHSAEVAVRVAAVEVD